jgi:hypothetical protein
MWQSPNPKTRASGGKAPGDRRSKTRFHIRRVRADLRTVSSEPGQGLEIETSLLLNDLSPQGVGLSSSQEFKIGQELTIQLTAPSTLTLTGKVAHCHKHENASHIISEKPIAFRLGIQFIFASAEEEESFKKFCEDLQTEILNSEVAA